MHHFLGSSNWCFCHWIAVCMMFSYHGMAYGNLFRFVSAKLFYNVILERSVVKNA